MRKEVFVYNSTTGGVFVELSSGADIIDNCSIIGQPEHLRHNEEAIFVLLFAKVRVIAGGNEPEN